MRLSSLKLTGFKSFADRTTLHFKANRTAVVGPNGCGKSNVIDAIRWVMGESNARQLRGGSMQDVIFTGTAQRKAVGMASVELRFENTAGKLGGAYRAYNELSVRRQVNREGKSTYFLNGSKCRRRDITDIFLGTGLGPRSYAIIEQGMINRLVDAKPEDMRVYIEEAAGVSRYQARRRETLGHLEQTSNNLARLEDIEHGLQQQLKALKRQAQAAVNYQTLEQEIQQLQTALVSFHLQQREQEQHNAAQKITALAQQFEQSRSALAMLEQEVATTHAQLQGLLHQSTPLQQTWQQAEQQAAACNLKLQQQREQYVQQQQQAEQLTQHKATYHQHAKIAEIQLETLLDQVDVQQQQLEQKQHQLEQQQQHYAKEKQQQQQLTQLCLAHKAELDEQQRLQQQHRHQAQQLDKQQQRHAQQMDFIQQQLETLEQHQQVSISELEQQHALLQHQLHATTTELKQSEDVIQTLHAEEQALAQQVYVCQQQLKFLQQQQQYIQQGFAQQSLESNLPNLVNQLQLRPEAKPHVAVIEKLLANWLKSYVLTPEQHFELKQARQLKQSQQTVSTTALSLADWITSPQHASWASVLIVEDIERALAQQAELLNGQTILSLDGYHVGPDWLIGLIYDEHSQVNDGALSQRLRLEQLQQEQVTISAQQQQLMQQHQAQQVQLSQQQQRYKVQQAQQQAQQQALHTITVQLAQQQAAQQAYAVQQQQLQQQFSQLEAQRRDDAATVLALEHEHAQLEARIAQRLPEYQHLDTQLAALIEQLDQMHSTLQQDQQHYSQLNRELQATQQQIALLTKDHQFAQQHVQQHSAQLEQLQHDLQRLKIELPVLEQQAMQQQQHASQLATQWQHWQQQLQQLQTAQDQLSQQRQQQQQQHERVRTSLEQQRLVWQVATTELAHYQQQLQALGTARVPNITIEVATHQQRLEDKQKQLQKLGAVNLTAAVEYQQVEARHQELSHQINDLKHTVAQLQAAMKSIDQETRKLFMQTFDQVNIELKQLFPKVFGGGEACLMLEGDWQSGVKLMARPPGKRNSSLALLSGGEKALTALALVFAIFRLNPAPFCVLDEVDAPLDDANVGRFCHLVKELSEQVQFIYISHNKLAMTMATDLLGVTMPEAGTSQLVSVNLEQAEQYLVAES